jgi:DNA-binding CsgD family transcriptional regulator
VPPAHRLALDWQHPAVLVAVHEGSERPFPVSAVLRDLFALTPAEMRLATLLTTGVGLPEACEQLAIRRETSRTQLKSIFTKTGTRTQAQLAHLLTRLGVGLVQERAA